MLSHTNTLYSLKMLSEGAYRLHYLSTCKQKELGGMSLLPLYAQGKPSSSTLFLTGKDAQSGCCQMGKHKGNTKA